MKTRNFASLTAALLILLATSQAFALDAWRDRRGLFFGLGAGASSGKADTDGAKSHIGFDIRARVGGGVKQELTLDAEFGLHNESYDERNVDISTQLLTGFIGVNYFVLDGLYLRGKAGVGHVATEPEGGEEDTDTGLGFGLGAGYEFFANGDLAVGVGGDFQVLQFEDFNYSLVHFGVTGTWY